MGGVVAMVLAGCHPELVDRLVITCSFGRFDRAARLMHDTRRSAAQYGGTRAFAELICQQSFSRGFWDRIDADATRKVFIDALERITIEEFFRDLSLIQDIDISEEIRKIKSPTLLLSADEDISTPLKAAPSGIGMIDLHEMIPGSELEVFTGCGHFISIEHPGKTAERIVRWLLEAA